MLCRGFPGGRGVKNLPANARGRRLVFNSELGRSPGGGNGNPLQYFCLPGQSRLVGYSPRDCRVPLNPSNSLYSSHTRVPFILPRCPEVLPSRLTQDISPVNFLFGGNLSCDFPCPGFAGVMKTEESASQVRAQGPVQRKLTSLLLATSACLYPPILPSCFYSQPPIDAPHGGNM